MLISNRYVPAEGNPASKIWLIGEAPGWHEDQECRPFVGDSGRELENALSRVGLTRDDVFITNLCHYRPVGNKFEVLLKHDALYEGIHEIRNLLETYRPNVIVALGAYPLQFLTGKQGIGKYRGSILTLGGEHFSEFSDHKIKVIPTYHPAFILRNRGNQPVFSVDFQRIRFDAEFPELRYTEREIYIADGVGYKATLIGNEPPIVEEHPFDYGYWLERVLSTPIVSSDIESVKGSTTILCVGFGLSANLGVVIPHYDAKHREFISCVLSSKVEKVFHFGTYDVNVLLDNGYEVNNYTHDTLLQAHVLAPELPRDLAYLVSISTREPYFKEDGRKEIPGNIKGWSTKRNKKDLYIYNGRDICTTIEIHFVQVQELLEDGLLNYYQYRMRSQHCAIEIGRNGLARDMERVGLLKLAIEKKRAKLWMFLNKLAGRRVRNVANKEICKLLYDELGLPARKKTDRKTGKQTVTADEDAIVGSMTYVKNHISKLKRADAIAAWKAKLGVLTLILQIRECEKQLSSYINISDYGGRVRSLYKVGGTETGRWSNSKYVDESGLNIQTIPRVSVKVEEWMLVQVAESLK